MKAWYDDIDTATLQRIKTYSAFNDATSKNLMVQTMYEYREKEIQDFKETNHELAKTCIERKKRIAELEKENNRLSRKCECLTKNNESIIDILNDVERLEKENSELKEKLNFSTQYYRGEKAQKQLTKAKEILREYIRINLLPPIERNFDDEVKLFKQAEQFLNEVSE